MPPPVKERTSRFLDIRDPAKSVGLWSHRAEFSTTLHPISPTRETLGRFFNDDLVRFETRAEALEMMRVKGWKKTAPQKLKEYAAQYLGERYDEQGRGEWTVPPRWFSAWNRYAAWLKYAMTATPYADVRLSFDSPFTGYDLSEPKHRTSRVVILRRNGRKYAAVMMKDGWYGWDVIEKPAYQDDPYERLVLSGGSGMRWQTLDAEIISELVRERRLCLFAMDEHPFFDALTDDRNRLETLAGLSRNVEFYVHDPNGPAERFYMTWSATFNPRKRQYHACNKSTVRIVEVMSEQKRGWAGRQIKVSDASEAEAAARWVVEHNGCVVVPPDLGDDLRYAVMHALFYITFPDRPIDAPGGLLRGYQLPGRMVQLATGPVRHAGGTEIAARAKSRARDSLDRKRVLVVETLLGRAARALAARNGLSEDEARARIEGADGRAVLEAAAWRRGVMEGNALNQFAPTPQAGSLKLPDLSLALGFEHRLGLDGGRASAGRLVQTARIVSLDASPVATRFCKEVKVRAQRLFTPRPGTEGDTVAFADDTVRIVRDEGRYLLLAIPKFARYRYGRDLLFEPDPETKRVPVRAYRCVSDEGTRSRQDVRIEEELFDAGKVLALAREGRVYLYSLDVGEARWLFDAVYTTANRRPCRVIPSIPQLCGAGSGGVAASADAAEVRVMFTFNPQVPRDGRKCEGRSWEAYCSAYPADAAREVVAWPGEGAAGSLQDAVRRVVAADGVLLTDEEHLDEALDAMGYVVTQTADPYAPGGVYRGYMLGDRVFCAKRRSRRSEADAPVGTAFHRRPPREGRAPARPTQRKGVGEPLADVLSPALAEVAEQAFAERIEAETLADGKTSKSFTLEAPIVIGEDFKAMVSREFRRIVYTGTMGWRQQIVRPAREVALGIWLATLSGEEGNGRKGGNGH